MTAPSLRAAVEAALPCVHLSRVGGEDPCTEDRHWSQCPAHYRDRVLAALAALAAAELPEPHWRCWPRDVPPLDSGPLLFYADDPADPHVGSHCPAVDWDSPVDLWRCEREACAGMVESGAAAIHWLPLDELGATGRPTAAPGPLVVEKIRHRPGLSPERSVYACGPVRETRAEAEADLARFEGGPVAELPAAVEAARLRNALWHLWAIQTHKGKKPCPWCEQVEGRPRQCPYAALAAPASPQVAALRELLAAERRRAAGDLPSSLDPEARAYEQGRRDLFAELRRAPGPPEEG